jgi:DNA-binding response OmpR family regulator
MEAEPRKIVIIEDEPDTAEMYAEMMRISGYEVVKYFSGGPAIAEIAEQKPDAIVLDIMMPDISGYDVLRYLKGESTLSNVPVIIVSAKTLPSDIKQGMEAGATIYLTKPVTFNDLKTAIDDAISQE